MVQTHLAPEHCAEDRLCDDMIVGVHGVGLVCMFFVRGIGLV